MVRLHKWWNSVSIVKKLYFVVGIMAVLIATELVILRVAMRTLSASRAFVGGESLWSKAQKNAVVHLQRFSETGDINDYRDFLKSLEIPKGDRLARLELSKPNPDLAVVHQGFASGQIHRDDIDLLIELLQRFSHVSYIAKAIVIWTKGDELLAELENSAETFFYAKKAKDEVAANAALNRVKILNAELTVLESDFSAILGEGCRWLESILLTVLIMIVFTVEGIGLTMAFLISRELSHGLGELGMVAERLGHGDFDQKVKIRSEDEIGKLALAINTMGEMLKGSYRDLEKRVAEAVDSRDEFLSIASHELKSPLTSLHIHAQMLPRLIKSLPPTAESEKAAGIAENSLIQVKRLTTLLNELLDLTRIRIGNFEVFRTKSNLTTVIKEAIELLRPEATRAGCELTFTGEEFAEGQFDAIRMTEVATNLISNAIKYGKGKPIAVNISKTGDSVQFYVKDEGIGIPLDQQGRLFERFERGKADRQISGLGLGLYITYQIVKAHNGIITIESKPQLGSTFTVSIPA